MDDKWAKRFLELARHISSWSKDPSTKVGCVVVGPDKEIRSTGFNGFPRGVKDDERLHERELKYPIICHAEENSIMHAARIGISLKGCVAFVTHPPCCRCARSLIQAGINEVVFYNVDLRDNWSQDTSMAKDIMNEAGMTVTALEPPKPLRAQLSGS